MIGDGGKIVVVQFGGDFIGVLPSSYIDDMGACFLLALAPTRVPSLLAMEKQKERAATVAN
jgi:hypothetical protein